MLPNELGTHSFRKGAASWAAAFFGVSMTAIYLRAGWTIGVVQMRYIFLAVFSDSNIGRILAGTVHSLLLSPLGSPQEL